MTTPPVHQIDGPEAAGRLADFTIIDVRQPEELVGELGHIAGSINIPLGDVRGGTVPPGVQKDAPLLLVCRSGRRSDVAAAVLAGKGFADVYNLRGGMIAWSEAGLPVNRRR